MKYGVAATTLSKDIPSHAVSNQSLYAAKQMRCYFIYIFLVQVKKEAVRTSPCLLLSLMVQYECITSSSPSRGSNARVGFYVKVLKSSASLNSTFPSLLTVATLKCVRLSAERFCASELCNPSSFEVGGSVTADWTAPAGVSAISLTSRVVRTSLRREARDWRSIVVGPWNWRNNYENMRELGEANGLKIGKSVAWTARTLSPQMVLLDHVRTVNKICVRARHVSDSRMALTNLECGSKLLRFMLGVWKRRLDDFSR